MRGLRLRASAAIDDPEAGDGTGVVIGCEHRSTKRCVTDQSTGEHALSTTLKRRAVEQLGDQWVAVVRLQGEPPTIGRIEGLGEPRVDDLGEVGPSKRSYRAALQRSADRARIPDGA